jgi:hypothetical protein
MPLEHRIITGICAENRNRLNAGDLLLALDPIETAVGPEARSLDLKTASA